MRRIIPAGSVGILFIILPFTTFGQSLGLSSSTVTSGNTVSLNLTLTSATPVAGLQWVIAYPAGTSNILVTAGAPLTTAGKSLSCVSTALGYSCVASGMNAKAIAGGVIATVSATVSGAGAVSFGIGPAIGANPAGGAVAVAGIAGTVTITPAVTISSMVCNLLSLGPLAADTCTVKLSGPATAGGVNVALGTTGSLTSAASLLIPAGVASGTFAVTAGQFNLDQSATVTASLGSSFQSATLSLVAPVQPVSLACAAASLPPNANTACTVTLNKAPAAGVSVAISGAIASTLTLPASVTVAANAISGTFTASTAAVPSTVNATIKVSLNGYSQTAGLKLTASVQVLSLQCVSPTLSSNASTTCTVLLTGPAAASGAPIVLSNTNPAALKAPISITAPAGSNSATFTIATGTLGADGSSTLTASAYGSSATASVGLSASIALSSLTCVSKSLTAGGLTNCTAKLAQPAPLTSLVTISISSNNSALQVLTPQVVVPGISSSVSFPILAVSFSGSQAATLTASLYGISRKFSISLVASALVTSPLSLSCPQTASPGGTAICSIQMSAPPSAAESVRVSSSSSHLRVPALVPLQAGQTTIRFAATVDSSAAPENVVVGAGSDDGTNEAQASVGIELAAPVVLHVPAEQVARPDSSLQFQVSATAADGLPTTLAVQDLPGGAAFDPGTGNFSWIPAAEDLGPHDVVFSAATAAGVSSSKPVHIVVGSKPELRALRNAAGPSAEAACAPGSAASLVGRLLFSGDSSREDRSGAQSDLGGTRVLVNGTAVPVLFASAGRVDFVCPTGTPGTELEIAVQSGPDVSNSLSTIMAAGAPGLLTVGDSAADQAIAYRPNTSEIAALPNWRKAARPATPGEILSFLATGVACDGNFSAGRPQLQIGMHVVPAETASPAANMAGVCALGFQVPVGPAGDSVPVTLVVRHYDGTEDMSNRASIAIAER